ncbi:MAG TPA: lysophospholipid acyltransferase family protein [Actinomycetota bacterium]|nr:lysophospholipid acyltransferase family protein [Actinomycetota bacterium]
MKSDLAPGRTEPLHFTGRASGVLRGLMQLVVLWPVVRWFCHPLAVRRARALPQGPLVFVANHSSHADTAVILKALPRRLRRRTHPAAAEDHFWRSQVVGGFVSLLTGAFPFPRRGTAGIDRAHALLERGHSVLLFPEGTRSCDGSVHSFHKGAALLAERGATIVPVGLAGTGHVLPKGTWRPRPAPVAVVFGAPLRPAGDADEVSATLQAEVETLAGEAARLARPKDTRRFDRVTAAAGSRGAVAAMAVWAVAEALAWPVIPDFFLLPLVVLAPHRWRLLFAAALAGSLAGGVISYAAGSGEAGRALLEHAPLVTDRMVGEAAARLADGGGGALLTQPLAGIPYKVFSYQAAPAGVTGVEFVAFSAVARGARFLAMALIGAALGRWLRPLWKRFGGHALVLYAAAFGVGLFRVVAVWS